ncbi:hypothetical protein Acr_00g0089750 [Actinidia rufa]|uniref:Uncharacterized protein n=1 Tax=Actinidia rufa TaxID=165716 RepID=A0A7J0DX15_9ERIC|nr:hypothetical protein Acr_00g0089750 [Actinidia rufa]
MNHHSFEEGTICQTCRYVHQYLAWSTAHPEVESVDHSQEYSSFVLPILSEEKLLEEAADEVSEKAPEVAGELVEEAVAQSGAADDEASPDLSPNL